MLNSAYMVLTPEFFESLGRLTFEFAALEQMIGLCILQLNPAQDEQKLWSKPFHKKVGRLKQEIAKVASKIRVLLPDTVLLDELIHTTQAVGWKRNTIVHGTLHYHPTGSLVLKNRAHGTTHALDADDIDALTAEVSILYDRFVDLRGDCFTAGPRAQKDC